MRDSDVRLLKAEKLQAKWDDMAFVETHINECPDLILVASQRSNKFHWIELCGEKIKNPVLVDNTTLTDNQGKKYEVCEKCARILANKIRYRKGRNNPEMVIV